MRFRYGVARPRGWLVGLLVALFAGDARGLAQTPAGPFDVLIRGGLVYDGTGSPPVQADVAIRGDQIVAIGNLAQATAKIMVDAKDLAVAPGFINMLSWSEENACLTFSRMVG